MSDRLEKLEEFLKENPKDCFVRHAMALEYIKRGNEDKARVLFEEVLRDNPDYTGSYYHLAKLFERLGNEVEATRIYETGMEYAKKNKDELAFRELKAAWEELTY